MDHSPLVSSVHGISQARILEWVPISSSRDLPELGIKPMFPALACGFSTREPRGKPRILLTGLHLSILLMRKLRLQLSYLLSNLRLDRQLAGDLGFGSGLKDYGAMVHFLWASCVWFMVCMRNEWMPTCRPSRGNITPATHQVQLISTLVVGFPDHVPLFRAITLNKSGAQDLELPCHKLGKRRVPQHRLSYAGVQMAFQGRDSFGFPKASWAGPYGEWWLYDPSFLPVSGVCVYGSDPRNLLLASIFPLLGTPIYSPPSIQNNLVKRPLTAQIPVTAPLLNSSVQHCLVHSQWSINHLVNACMNNLANNELTT